MSMKAASDCELSDNDKAKIDKYLLKLYRNRSGPGSRKVGKWGFWFDSLNCDVMKYSKIDDDRAINDHMQRFR